ncbi:TetR/AcrR family transcriptional regulator [Xanthobacter sediminis]|uniref:TetR/AcrR family transcriptional regulator n=1 Tax=Xanthobacter sediminis TaxID=3119926 RepID=UPI00372913A2
MTSETAREACLRAFLDLLSGHPEGCSPMRIDLAEVAAASGVALSEMRTAYGSVDDLLAAFFRATDRHVLAEGGPDAEDFAGEGPRERLFEVLMRRLDALEPHRAAVRALVKGARRDPLLALALLRLSARSQRWMLAAAGVGCTGLQGAVRAKGLALLFARVVEVWLDDEDPGLSRTMAKLDHELTQAGKLLDMLDDLAFIVLPWRTRRRNAPPRRGAPGRDAADDEAQAPAAH